MVNIREINRPIQRLTTGRMSSVEKKRGPELKSWVTSRKLSFTVTFGNLVFSLSPESLLPERRYCYGSVAGVHNIVHYNHGNDIFMDC